MNWDHIEKELNRYQSELDCLPTNAREWNKFRTQYEGIVKFMGDPNSILDNVKRAHPLSFPNDDGGKIHTALLNVLHEGGYKKSPSEMFDDTYYSPVKIVWNHLCDVFKNAGGDLWLVRSADRFVNLCGGGRILPDDVRDGKIAIKLPRNINGSVHMDNLGLTSLEGCPRTTYGAFDCSYNRLKDLTGGPVKVGHTYNCSNNDLVSLNGIALYIDGAQGYDIDCTDNPKLNDFSALKDTDKDLKVFAGEKNKTEYIQSVSYLIHKDDPLSESFVHNYKSFIKLGGR